MGICGPHPSLSRMASAPLIRTTAGSWTEHSVDVERDITGYNPPTPTRKVTPRLMSVVVFAGYMLGHRKTWTGEREIKNAGCLLKIFSCSFLVLLYENLTCIQLSYINLKKKNCSECCPDMVFQHRVKEGRNLISRWRMLLEYKTTTDQGL